MILLSLTFAEELLTLLKRSEVELSRQAVITSGANTLALFHAAAKCPTIVDSYRRNNDSINSYSMDYNYATLQIKIPWHILVLEPGLSGMQARPTSHISDPSHGSPADRAFAQCSPHSSSRLRAPNRRHRSGIERCIFPESRMI